jgi:Ca2+-transporting ATPase
VGLFHNVWLWLALAASLAAQISVLYVPALQRAFSTVPLSLRDWLECIGLASLTLLGRELSKLVVRMRAR